MGTYSTQCIFKYQTIFIYTMDHFSSQFNFYSVLPLNLSHMDTIKELLYLAHFKTSVLNTEFTYE